jgi:hypothetical protein
VALQLDVLEASFAHPRGQGARQEGVDQVVVPCAQEALHALRVLRVPGHGRPVDVPDHDPAAGLQHAQQLAQGRRDVRDVFEDLHRQRPVEVSIRHR